MYKINKEIMELLLRYNEFYGNDVKKPDLLKEIKTLYN